MKNINIESFVTTEMEIVIRHFDKNLFLALAPAFIPSRLIRFDGCQKGNFVEIELGFHNLNRTWISEITHNELSDDLFHFIDVGRQLPLPLTQWTHKHFVIKAPKGTRIIDNVQYSCGIAFLEVLVYPFIWWMFYSRKRKYKRFFDSLE